MTKTQLEDFRTFALLKYCLKIHCQQCIFEGCSTKTVCGVNRVFEALVPYTEEEEV